jgi:hypothetical protein
MSGLNMDFDQRGNLAAGRNTFVSTYSKAFHEILAQQNPQTGELCKAGICVLLENPEQALKEYFGSLNASASRFAIDWNLEEDSRPSYIEQQKTTARIKHYLVQQKKNSVSSNRLRIVRVSSRKGHIVMDWTEDFSADPKEFKKTVASINRNKKRPQFSSGRLVIRGVGTSSVKMFNRQ